MVRSTPRALNARGLKRPMGALMALGATQNGVYARSVLHAGFA